MNKIYTLAIAILSLTGGYAQYAWYPVGSGANLGVQAMDADTNSNTLYLGGIFTQAGGLPALGIARWDGANYSPCGTGIISGVGISALRIAPNGDVIAGGTFTDIGGVLTKNIAAWNGTNWSAIGSGLDVTVGVAAVKTLCYYNNELYAGGTFTQAGTTPVNYIAKWNGSSWQPLTSGTNGTVLSMCVYNNELYVGGSFTSAGGVAVKNIAKWNGSIWFDVAGGVDYTGAISVSALQVYGGDLYVGGTFTTAGTTPVHHIAKWNGSTWSDPGGGANYTGAISVSAFEVYHNELIAGGSFDSLGGNTAKYVGKWNGVSWSAMGLGMNLNVNSLKALRDTLYAGGDFTTADGNVAMFMAQWKGTNLTLNNHQYETETFTLYPNPARHNVYITHNFGNETLNFSLYDVSGREVFKQDSVKNEVNFDGKLAAGLYMYKITGKDHTVLKQGKIMLSN